MTAMTTSTSGGRPFTVDDLEAMPDDGHRYELLDGVLLVIRRTVGADLVRTSVPRSHLGWRPRTRTVSEPPAQPRPTAVSFGRKLIHLVLGR